MLLLLQQILQWHYGEDLGPDLQVADTTIALAADLVSNVDMNYGHPLNSGVAASILPFGLLSETQGAGWQAEAKRPEDAPSTKSCGTILQTPKKLFQCCGRHKQRWSRTVAIRGRQAIHHWAPCRDKGSEEV